MPLFFNPTATTEIYTLSLHDALPISVHARAEEPPALLVESDDALTLHGRMIQRFGPLETQAVEQRLEQTRSEEHTSELQSRGHLVCRLLLEKKKKNQYSR